MGSTSAAVSQVMGGGIKPGMGVSLETAQLSVDTEITGPLAAVLWVSSSSEDMDLFLTLRNFDPDGKEIMETGQQGAPVPVARAGCASRIASSIPNCRCHIGLITHISAGSI